MSRREKDDARFALDEARIARLHMEFCHTTPAEGMAAIVARETQGLAVGEDDDRATAARKITSVLEISYALERTIGEMFGQELAILPHWERAKFADMSMARIKRRALERCNREEAAARGARH